MKCRNCGKELVKIGTLTEQESEEWMLINKKMNNAFQALDSKVINEMEFTEGQVFEYFRAAYHGKAEADFLYWLFARNLKKRLGLNTNAPIDIFEENSEFNVYAHEGDFEDKE